MHHLAELRRCGRRAAIAGIEARGFIFGAAVAVQLGLGFVPVRKPGKLPVPCSASTMRSNTAPTGSRWIPARSQPGRRVVMVDDLIATGGTALAAAELLRMAGAGVEHALFVIDLPDLGGARPAARRGHGRACADGLSGPLSPVRLRRPSWRLASSAFFGSPPTSAMHRLRRRHRAQFDQWRSGWPRSRPDRRHS